jgi:hypothetical protein
MFSEIQIEILKKSADLGGFLHIKPTFGLASDEAARTYIAHIVCLLKMGHLDPKTWKLTRKGRAAVKRL